MGYTGLVEKIKNEMGHEMTDVDRPNLWTTTRIDEHENCMNEEVEGISQKIVS